MGSEMCIRDSSTFSRASPTNGHDAVERDSDSRIDGMGWGGVALSAVEAESSPSADKVVIAHKAKQHKERFTGQAPCAD